MTFDGSSLAFITDAHERHLSTFDCKVVSPSHRPADFV